MNLYDHQQKVLDDRRRRLMLAWEVGTGKTLALLSLADKHVDRVLIICPKGLRKQWEAKIREYGVLMHAHIVTKEEMRRDHAKMSWVNAVIIDEVHHFSGYRSQMHKALVKYLVRCQPQYVWTGTATPYRSEPFNVWALGVIHGHIPMNWVAFRDRFYHPRWLGRRMIYEPNVDAESKKALRAYMDAFTHYVKLEECFDMPDQVDEEPEELEENKEQRAERERIMLEESNHLVRVNALHQIENGSLKGNEFREDKQLGCAKYERLVGLAEEHGKLLIFCRYTLQIERLKRALAWEGRRVYALTGENSADHHAVCVEAERDPSCVVLAQISVAAGYELPSFKVVVFASMSYSYLDWVQARGRVIRGNKLGKHVFLYLLGGEVDRAVLECVREKRDFDPTKYSLLGP